MKTNSSPLKPDSITPTFSRRHALGLVLAGVALPATETLAATRQLRTVVTWQVRADSVRLVTCSGEGLVAAFESEMLVGSDGAARGYLRFAFEDGKRVDYVARRGGLDCSASGEVLRAWLLLRARGRSGSVAQDFALVTVAPAAGEDCLIYTTIGTDVNYAPVSFDVAGHWTLRP